MKKSLYTIYDSKTEYFHPPVVCHNDGDAKRVFAQLVTGRKSLFSEYPEDFTIYEIGTFDDSTASVVCFENKHLLCSVATLLHELKKQEHDRCESLPE